MKAIEYSMCVVGGLLASACSQQTTAGDPTVQTIERLQPQPPSGGSTEVAGNGMKPKVGAACSRSDGYQLAAHSDPNADSGLPHVVPVAAGWTDFYQLAPGVGYCLAPGEKNPWGYFTMNCATDNDCPMRQIPTKETAR